MDVGPLPFPVEDHDQLGRLADPPMTKDAVAGRIRRLLSMADRKAKVDGIPDTESAVTPDLLEDA